MIRYSLVALAMVFFVSDAPALEPLTRVHKSDKGYSIHFPADWTVADRQTVDTLRDWTAKMVNMPGKNPNVDLLLFKGWPAAGINLNVIIVPGRMPMNDEAKAVLRQMPQLMAEKMRTPIEGFTIRDESVGDLSGISSRWDAGTEFDKVTQFQFYTVKGGKTYIFTATGPSSEFRNLEPTFRMIIASLEVPLLDRIPVWLRAVLIGGVAGLALSVGGAIFRALGLSKS